MTRAAEVTTIVARRRSRHAALPRAVVAVAAMAAWMAAGCGPISSSATLLAEFEVGRGGRLLLLPVTLQGRSYPFAFDTGASHTVCDTALRPQLGAALPPTEVESSGGRMPFACFESTPLQLGPIELHTEDRVLGMDFEPFRRAYGDEIHGLIGVDALQAYVVQIDFDEGRFRVFDGPGSAVAGRDTPIRFAYHAYGVPMTRVQLPGRTPADFLIDTGQLGATTLRQSLFEHLEQEQLLNVRGTSWVQTPTGRERRRIGRLHSFRVGPFVHQDVKICEGRVSSFGLGYLSRYRVTLDFPGRVMYLAKGRRWSERGRDNLAGLNLLRIDGRLVVHSVAPGKAGERAGVEPGDVIVDIQGRPAGAFELLALQRELFAREGETIPMTLLRAGRVIRVTMQLRAESGPASDARGRDVRVPPVP